MDPQTLKQIKSLFANEPTLSIYGGVLILDVVQILVISASSGLKAGIAAGLSILGALLNRQLVTPVAKIPPAKP